MSVWTTLSVSWRLLEPSMRDRTVHTKHTFSWWSVVARPIVRCKILLYLCLLICWKKMRLRLSFSGFRCPADVATKLIQCLSARNLSLPRLEVKCECGLGISMSTALLQPVCQKPRHSHFVELTPSRCTDFSIWTQIVMHR